MVGESDLGPIRARRSRAGVLLRQAWTWPNLFTFARLLCLPLFCWLLFGRDNRAAAAWLLAGLGATDWVDGWMARRFDQATELGAMLDPMVDRLMFVVAIPSIIAVDAAPLLLAVPSLAREFLVGLAGLILTALQGDRFEVSWEGKTGTFLLMFAFPMFLGASSTLSYAGFLGWIAWLFVIPGLIYGWYAALFQYVPAVREARAARDARVG